MRLYETIFILSPEVNEEERNNLIEKFKKLITDNGGEITNFEDWGKKKLAYPIQKKQEGYYTLMNFNSEAKVPQELERVYKITEDVLRYLIVKVEK
ncbi:MAG: 30S ribosomal protein S6 [Thermoanaerobacteraceae bacterium]